MPDKESTLPGIVENTPHFGLDDCFSFQCGSHMDCFTKCCQGVSILLTPYDVLKLKRGLGINSSEFLDQYTFVMQSKEKKIPAVFLKMSDDKQVCPFVSDKGCSVYTHRPWACRMYPLGMAEPKNPEQAAQRFYFLLKEDLCHGHGVGAGCTVKEWIAGQNIEPYDVNQVSFRQLMGHPGWDNPELLTGEKLAMFYMAAYDLDRFRSFVFDTRFLEVFEVDEARVEALRTDDVELLEFGMDWLAFSLFGEKKRMKLKKNAKPRCVPVAEVAAPVEAGL